MKLSQHLALIGLALLIAAPIIFYRAPSTRAQSATATLSGSVVDEQGNVVSGAEVRLSNPATSLERTGTTNDDGLYVFTLLPPGSYAITAQRSGFATATLKDIVLNVGDQRAIRIQLNVGQVGETVNVVGDSGVQESATVGTVVDRQFVGNLPLNGRSLQTLINLAPGVVIMPATEQNPGQFSVNGQRTSSNYFSVDGVSANFGANPSASVNQAASGAVPATNIQGGFSNLASIDALQEFKIQTSTFAPEFGRSPGANVSLITRSGANQFRGSLYEYFRNDVFDANDWFNNRGGLAKPALRHNNYGGTLGGPVILPRFGEGDPALWRGRDKTFFFFSYEGQRFLLPQGALPAVVPSLAARTNAPNEVARQILNALPLPNGAELRNAAGALTGGALFTAAFSEPSVANATSIRIDHNFNQKYSLFGRYNYAPANSESRSRQNLSQFTDRRTATETLTFGATQVFTATLVNEVRVNGSRQDGASRMFFDGFGGGVAPPETALFPPNVLNGSRQSTIQLRGLLDTTVSASVILNTESLFQQRQINVVDNLSYSRGAHQLKFGVDYRWLSPVIAPLDFNGLISFTNLSGVNNNVAATVTTLREVNHTLQFPAFSAYAQDTWRVSPRLTLTYGARWELNPAPTGRGDKQPLTVKELRNLTGPDFSYLELAPPGTPLYPARYNNFAPRVGLAYQVAKTVGHELVLRGGWGIFYDLGQNGFGSIAFPFRAARSFTNVTVPLPATIGVFPSPNLTLSPTNRASGITLAAPDFDLPLVYQWNMKLEQSLGKDQTISAAYVAAAGRGLLRTSTISLLAAPDPNNPTKPFSPNFSGLVVRENGSTSDYHALQVQFNRRLARGLQALLSYTWSHSLDSGSSDIDRTAPERLADTNIDRGNSSFDVRHSFSGAFTYNIPAPTWGRVASALLCNWSFNSVFFARTATPLDLSADELQGNVLFGSSFTRRPNLIPGVPFYINDPAVPGGRRVNPAVFTFPSNTQPEGTLGRNVLRGFGAWQADVGLHRQFNLTERLNLQFRAEVFNVLNHPNFANPGAPFSTVLRFPTNPPVPGAVAVDDGLFGRSTGMLSRGLGQAGTAFNPVFQVGGPRSMQFALRLAF